MQKDVASVCQGGLSARSLLAAPQWTEKNQNCGFPHCPELKLETLGWSEHFGMACPPYPQVLVLSLSHLSFRAPRPFLVETVTLRSAEVFQPNNPCGIKLPNFQIFLLVKPPLVFSI